VSKTATGLGVYRSVRSAPVGRDRLPLWSEVVVSLAGLTAYGITLTPKTKPAR
jgi:hypothetical protein